ncbi:MAG TPA: hypothetical protein VKH42_04150 [Vicinamibacterales bacterium]|nr:hypothetical protein [Vicinamibacterales bacterium]
MPCEIEASNWSGEGTFTQLVIDHLRAMEKIRFLRVEDAPATRSDADYNFISNEIYVAFDTIERTEPTRRFGFLPGSKTVAEKAMTLRDLDAALTTLDAIGEPDYGDETMLQYLRTERIIPPYQTRGYKIVELLRVYEVGTPRRD